ncbi:MAG: HAMP domain-containing histidine kinase [Sulfurimonas sp.]|uniref:sensor histidine kinase n=1 Tax=Sulfurimonas sp. TaxID=2022749 RepID=UPI0025ED43FB|nr:HAMP domain-containing sensor histidine kinase [Sulfurimonas sp.]MCK9491862.1 HAMP domain-containing histidine kinase [Sulfurimonas sp.]
MNKISIKFKLRLLFLILLLAITAIGYKSISISQDNKDRLEMVHSKSQNLLSLQDKIITPLYNLRELSQALVMAPNKKIRETIFENLAMAIDSLDEAFLEYSKENIRAYEMWLNYKSLVGVTKDYLDSEFEEGAYLNITTAGREQFMLLVGELLVIQSDLLSKSSQAYSEAVKDVANIKIETFIALFIILLFSIIAGSLISNNIISSIYKVQNGLREFFEYLNHKREKASKIDLISSDEFSDIANMINENVQTIQNNIEKDEILIKNATRVLLSIKSGNLGDRLDGHTHNMALGELREMINDMIENLEDKIQQEIQKRLENEQILLQQSKLASMGEMIGNIAHQWRQPLAQVIAIFMNMKVTYDFDKFTSSYLNQKIEEANKLTKYMSQTIDDFQNFFNPHSVKEVFCVERACRDALFIVESSLKHNHIKVEFQVLDELKILGHKNEYSQVVLNIINNAKNILLEKKIKEPLIKIEIKEGDNFAIVKIGDNGGGVPTEFLEKIFEPYFTTRHKTQGTGIGLYMSKNIIEKNMQGYLNVKNIGDGACFTIKVQKH